jgi:hypothetical protein
MNNKGKKWFADLQQHIKACRQATPLPDRGTLTTEQEIQCRIVGGSVISWLKEHGPHFLQERQVLHKMMDVSPDPWIVFTSNVSGLSEEGKDRAGKPLKVLSRKMRKVFGDFDGHVSIQRSPPRWVEPKFVDRAIEFVEELE